MVKSDTPRAHRLEFVVGADFEGFANKALFVLDSGPGLWRKVKKGAKPEEGDVRAIHSSAFIDLRLDRKATLELVEAGYVSTKPAPVPSFSGKADQKEEAGELPFVPEFVPESAPSNDRHGQSEPAETDSKSEPADPFLPDDPEV